MKTRFISLLALLFIMAGCSSSRITTSWKAENAVPRHYNKIMVLGLIREGDASLQEHMENHLVGDLQTMGYNAVSAFKEYGPKAFTSLNEDEAIAKLKNSGVDAVITVVLLDKQKEKKYVPGNTYYTPYRFYYNRFWGYRTTLYNRIHEPGYYVTDTRYFWESNLYEMDSQRLIYTVQTESFDPVSTDNMAHEYGQIIVNDMLKNAVIKKD
ncbi:MAG: hypothetical protein U0X40_06440 [Ferruginibacter sp.]